MPFGGADEFEDPRTLMTNQWKQPGVEGFGKCYANKTHSLQKRYYLYLLGEQMEYHKEALQQTPLL